MNMRNSENEVQALSENGNENEKQQLQGRLHTYEHLNMILRDVGVTTIELYEETCKQGRTIYLFKCRLLLNKKTYVNFDINK